MVVGFVASETFGKIRLRAHGVHMRAAASHSQFYTVAG